MNFCKQCFNSFQNLWNSLFFFILFAVSAFPSFGQITVKFKPDSLVGKDAFLEFSNGCVIGGRPTASELVNFGVHPELYYMQWTYSSSGCGQGTQRTLIKFNQLSTIPPTAVITNAELNLFGVSSSGSFGTSYYPGSPYPSSNEGWVERVTGSWNEFTVTWNTQPTTTATNRVGIPFSATRWNWNTSVNVTTLVNDIRASGSNEGFMLKLRNEAIYRSVIFASSDNPDTTRWPELVITYLDPCSGTKADYNHTNTSCYTFQFSDNSVAKDSGIVSWSWDFGDMTTSTLKNPIKTYLDYGDYNVRLIVTDSGGCIDTITKLVSIKYNHFANAGRDTILCLENNTATTFLRGNGGVSYNWTPRALLSHPDSKNTYATINAPTSFMLFVVDAFGCKDQDTVDVKLYPKTILKNIPKDTAICSGNSVQLNASGAISYDWSPAASLSNSKISKPIALNVTNAKTYIVTGTDANGCQGLDTVNIRLHPAANIKTAPNNYSGCIGDAITFNAIGGSIYKWSPSEGLSSDSISNPTHILNAPIKYFVKGQTTEGCFGEDSVSIIVYPAPIVDAYSISGQNIVRCKGVEINLSATGASRYFWSPAEYCSTPNGSTTAVFPSANTIFTVSGMNDNGCVATDTISVIYDGTERVFLPNTFTPNNDLINDKIGVIDQCNIQFLSIEIFNRWGQSVFSGYNIFDKWDGNFNNKPCDMGTYFYLVKARTLSGLPINFKGDISLIR